MRAVQPPPADDDPRPGEAGRVIDLPAGALSSGRQPRARSGRTARPPRPAGAAADLGAALNASLADVSVAAERLAGSGGVVPPAAPRPSRPAASRPSPSAPAAQRRPRAVPRPPAWEPVPWAEASAASERPSRSARSTQVDRADRAGRPDRPHPAPRPAEAPPAARPSAPAASRTAIATVPFPTSPPEDVEPEPALWGGDAPPPDAAGTELVRTVPGWALAVMVVIVAVVACLAGYLLLRP